MMSFLIKCVIAAEILS